MGKCRIEYARVYVTSEQRCKSGNRFGIWMQLNDYPKRSVFLKACNNLFIDEEQPVLTFLDWEDVPVHFISETGISAYLFRLINHIMLFQEIEKIAFAVWLGAQQHQLPNIKADVILNAFKISYQGYFGFRQEFTTYYAKEELGITKQSNPRFDFISFNRYLFNDLFVIDSGFVFRKIKGRANYGAAD